MKVNEREVKAGVEKVLDQAVVAAPPPPSQEASVGGAPNIQQALEQALANLNLTAPGASNSTQP